MKQLSIREYDVATQDDLWEFLTTQALADETLASDVTVKEIMDTYTVKMGYPLLTVALNGDGTATLSQVNIVLNYICIIEKYKVK